MAEHQKCEHGCLCSTCAQLLKTIHCDDCWDKQYDRQVKIILTAARLIEDINFTRHA